MPGGHSGGPSGHGYLFVVAVPFEQVKSWYRERMERDGWSSSVRQQSAESLIGGGPMVSLDFQRPREQVNVMLIYSIREQYTMVMLTRVAPSS
jgi:hypothetical protein